ncbi:hypothetical protein [Shinella granuli]|uniref:Uncharacterized protein n=1 Tax=Shinella granuli TaxID=323621 RepID=A0A4R2C3K1_SHIGR|nr:hypothetical protein [Shinella granuli]TCN34938.1 hypothetical protein EV665_13117 [Shinella granuli]
MEKPTSIYLLLATYWQRMDELTEAMTRTDATERETAEHAAALAAQIEAGERVRDAEAAIAAFVPKWRYEAKTKASFLAALADENHGTLDAEVTAGLLSSLADVVRWQDTAGRASA